MPRDCRVLKRLQPLSALGTITGRVDVADPPKESGLHFRVSSVVFFLQVGHHVDGVRSGQVGVDDAVAQARVGLLLLDKGVGIDDPVHGAVPDGVGTNWDAVLVEEADHLSINSRVGLRIAAIARARTCDIWRRARYAANRHRPSLCARHRSRPCRFWRRRRAGGRHREWRAGEERH